MADDPTTDPAATTDPPKTDPPATDPPQDGLSDAGKAAIRKEREAARAEKKRADELAARLKEFEDRDKTDLEKLTEERDTLKAQASENLRLKVALSKGLVGDLAFIADRLQGSTQKELEADADALLEKIGARSSATDFDAGARDTTVRTDDMNARIRAAAGRR